MPTVPTLHLIAGVNGSGKTTFYRFFLQLLTPDAEFVNADEIAHERWPGSEATHNPEAARYSRTQNLIPQAAEIADITMVFDNSGRSGTATHTFVLRLAEGRLVSRAHGIMPLWVREAYARFLVDRD